jgi:hypothetical protein
MVEGARTMANHISPAAQLFRSMADLVDHDHTSHTDYEAVTRAAEALAARASTEQLVAGPLWEADGASLLAAAYAFHAGLPRQAATATHVQALAETSPAPSNGGEQTPQGDPSPARQAMLQVGPPRPLRRRARALPQWTQSVCLALPFTTWTQLMRPSSGPPSPSFGVARSCRAASSSG